MSQPVLPVHHGRSLPTRSAFTLVEILVVVVILGILAAIIVPQVTSANSQTCDNSLMADLYLLRTQLQVYQVQHGGGLPTVANFVNQMTMGTDINGNTGSPGSSSYPYGPYIPVMPNNPWTSTNTVGSGAVGSSAWYFNPANGNFNANDSTRTFAF